MSRRRVVITGMGAVSPAGAGVGALWRAVRTGSPLGSAITKFDASRNLSRVAATVARESLDTYGLDAEELRQWDASTHYGVVAAAEAAAQATLAGLDLARCGVVTGSAIGGTEAMERIYAELVVAEAPDTPTPAYPRLRDVSVPPWMLWAYACNTISLEIAQELRFGGPVTCVSTGCTAGVDAAGYALDLLRDGQADLMLAGGVDAPVTPICLSAFDAIRALTRHNHDPQGASRPFDATRDGFLLAEGAGFVVMEELEHALRRGAAPLAEVVGYGTNCNAFHMTSMHESGATLAFSLELALRDAGLRPEQIDYINAHGSSTPQNDRAETAAYKSVFGAAAHQIPISSTKSVTGHALGAASALEIIISVLAIRESWIPPTANLRVPQPECDLDYVPLEGRPASLRHVLSNASGFGGLHSAVIVAGVGQ